MRVRPHIHLSVFACLWLTFGCHALLLNPAATDKAKRAEKLDKDAPPTTPSKHNFRVSQYVFFSDIELKKDHPIFGELAELRDQVYKELQLPTANTVVQVYIFENRERYERYMRSKYPELPKRRAFFVAQPRSVGGEDLMVYTFWGERIREDLRHELTHALLHSVLKDVPLWLDEGLAEVYEVPPEWDGVNYQHLDQMQLPRPAGGPLKPDLARLEQLSQVQQMAQGDYRESWAWVHMMLRDSAGGKKVLLTYLQQLRTNPNPGPMRPRLADAYPSPDEALQQHLAHLDAGPRPPSLAAKR